MQRQLDSPAWAPIEVQRVPWQSSLKEGDRVYIRGIAQPVEVIAPADSHDRVEVLLGTMRAKNPVYQFERQAEGHPVPAAPGVSLDRVRGMHPRTELGRRAHGQGGGGAARVRDGGEASAPELVRRVGAGLGRPARLFPGPAPLLRAAGRMTGKSAMVARLLDSLRVDDGQIRRDLGWAPPFTMDHGLDATAAWFTSPNGS